MTETVRVRPLADGDWDAVVTLERDAYTGLGLSEGRAALQSRAAASPDTCFVVDVGARTAGYVLALPYPPHRYPDLTRTEADRDASEPGNLHLHDIVVAPGLRRRGSAGTSCTTSPPPPGRAGTSGSPWSPWAAPNGSGRRAASWPSRGWCRPASTAATPSTCPSRWRPPGGPGTARPSPRPPPPCAK